MTRFMHHVIVLVLPILWPCVGSVVAQPFEDNGLPPSAGKDNPFAALIQQSGAVPTQAAVPQGNADPSAGAPPEDLRLETINLKFLQAANLVPALAKMVSTWWPAFSASC